MKNDSLDSYNKIKEQKMVIF